VRKLSRFVSARPSAPPLLNINAYRFLQDYQRFVDKDAQGKITQKDLFGVVVRAVCFAPTPPRLADFSPFWGIQYVPLTGRPE
jgi:hypothetical protein